MIKPYGDYILVETGGAEEKTESGIYLPEKKKDEPNTGIIIEVPDSMAGSLVDTADGTSKILPNKLHKGVKIWFKMWAGELIEKKDDKEIRLIHIKDVIAYETSK